jgi:hypothetical protein
MSPEDVLPRWMSKAIQRSTKKGLFEQYKFSNRTSKGPKSPKQRLALDAPVVCRPCNNGWMSQLDKLAQPILDPLLQSPGHHNYSTRPRA